MTLSARPEIDWDIAGQVELILSSTPKPVHPIVDSPVWPEDARIWQEWLRDYGYVEVDHSRVDKALISAYKHDLKLCKTSDLSLFEFAEARKLKLKSCKLAINSAEVVA